MEKGVTMEVILATRNKSKMEQIRTLFVDLPQVRLLSLDEIGITGSAVEDATTLAGNALKKAQFAFAKGAGRLVIAEDTGLFIDALDGQPGIHAARWAGNLSTEEIMRFTLQKLEGVPREKRTAKFATCAVLVWGPGNAMYFTGEVKGRFLREPRCACQSDMPYSAIFVPDGQKKVWAEMSLEEENRISHRGQAFVKLKRVLAKFE